MGKNVVKITRADGVTQGYHVGTAVQPPTAREGISSSAPAQQETVDTAAAIQGISQMHQHMKKATSTTPKPPLRFRVTRVARRAAVATATLAIAVGGLTACGSQDGMTEGRSDSGVVDTENDPGNSKLRSFMVKTVDGREIPCISLSSGAGRGLSCDWNYNGPVPSASPR